MLAVVASLAGLVKTNLSKTQLDNSIFKLHYRWTTTFCFLCCALIAASDFIGSPIQCLNADNVVTTYCWVSSTYTINTTSGSFSYYASHGSDVLGIGNFDPDLHEQTFHAYYQWVVFVLFLQGCIFYLPHLIWKSIEGKHAQNLLQGINVFAIDDDLDKKKDNIIKYLVSSRGLNQKYCFGYIFCECLNMLNVILQMFFLDAFFGGMFLQLGSKILSIGLEDDSNRLDPLIMTFPRVTKCDFFNFGPSGTIEKRDYLCILAQNILNEKVFLVMWVWFVFVCCATGTHLLYRLAMIQFPMIRLKLLEQRGKMASSYDLDLLVRELPIGDFFLLYTIGRNVNALCFRDILKGLFKNKPTAPTPDSLYNNSAYHLDTLDRKLRKKINDADEDTTV